MNKKSITFKMVKGGGGGGGLDIVKIINNRGGDGVEK